MRILGISAYYHDAAAALVHDGDIVAAAQEERFTRKRHDSGFPAAAALYCLEAAGISVSDLDFITFYDKPFPKFERLLETYLAFAPRGLRAFVKAMPVWLKEKVWLKHTLAREIRALASDPAGPVPRLLFAEHHQSHAASAFFPSPFRQAAVLCLDGVGEWATTSAWSGEGNRLTPLWEIHFPHSLGLLYSAFTYYCGFKVNSAEYKMMGLAPFGEPRYVRTIREHLIDIKDDGTFRLNMEYFDYTTGSKMTNGRFDRLFGAPRRQGESAITQHTMDVARSIQVVTEEVILKLARTIHDETGQRFLCLAGGVALNCVANGRLLREGPFRDLWIQPAAGDAGGALGAALATWHEYLNQPRTSGDAAQSDAMKGAYLGPAFDDAAVRKALDECGASYTRDDDHRLLPRVASLLAAQNVIGWFSGRMEFGPRALGARSILADPRSPGMQSTVNLKIKFRESFRPFAPAVLAEDAGDYFELDRASPYMLLVARVNDEQCETAPASGDAAPALGRRNVPRSRLPAVTHVDQSARVQTVHRNTNPRFHRLLSEFKRQTGCAVLVNTSFNVRGEPIVCDVADAYTCFMRTEMDYLVVGNYLLAKKDQPHLPDRPSWREEFELD